MAYKNKEDTKAYNAKYYQEHKDKRKTHTSTEVTQRYQKKVYKKYSIAFRKVEDRDCIDAIENEIAKGSTTSEAVKKIIRKSLNNT